MFRESMLYLDLIQIAQACTKIPNINDGDKLSVMDLVYKDIGKVDGLSF
jgi:hypothetical protein